MTTIWLRLLPLSLFLALWAFPYPVFASSVSEGEALLAQVAQRTADITTLHAAFQQEKHLGILSTPLISSGQMCLQRAEAPKADAVLWAYEKPTVSGFAYTQGQGWLWTDHADKRRQAQGVEATALKAVTEHILAWVRVQPEALRRLYTVERLPNTAEGCPVLGLVPRQSGTFFARLRVTFAPELHSVRQLHFEEKNGDSTVLTFSNVRRNETLPPVCQEQNRP